MNTPRYDTRLGRHVAVAGFVAALLVSSAGAAASASAAPAPAPAPAFSTTGLGVVGQFLDQEDVGADVPQVLQVGVPEQPHLESFRADARGAEPSSGVGR